MDYFNGQQYNLSLMIKIQCMMMLPLLVDSVALLDQISLVADPRPANPRNSWNDFVEDLWVERHGVSQLQPVYPNHSVLVSLVGLVGAWAGLLCLQHVKPPGTWNLFFCFKLLVPSTIQPLGFPSQTCGQTVDVGVACALEEPAVDS